MPRQPARALCLLALLALLSACAQLPSAPPVERDLGEFELLGRVAVRYGTDSASGRVQWRHTRAGDDMLITNPLGQGVARLSGVPGRMRLETSDGREFRAADAESLTERVLGWRLPLAGLPDWIQGRPRPGSEWQAERDGRGLLSSLSQDGWTVQYQEYSESLTPLRMRIARPGLELRLVVESLEGALPGAPH